MNLEFEAKANKLLDIYYKNAELLSSAKDFPEQPSETEKQTFNTLLDEIKDDLTSCEYIPIRNVDFLNFKSDKTFPIIIMGDVIEHVTDPEAALRNAYKLLDDDGVLWLSTPNFESSFTKLKKSPILCGVSHIISPISITAGLKPYLKNAALLSASIQSATATMAR